MADLFSHGLIKLFENFRSAGKLEALSIDTEIIAGIDDEDILIKGFGRGNDDTLGNLEGFDLRRLVLKRDIATP
jgi:hypothetical protein